MSSAMSGVDSGSNQESGDDKETYDHLFFHFIFSFQIEV
jgi:hypothetical protein